MEKEFEVKIAERGGNCGGECGSNGGGGDCVENYGGGNGGKNGASDYFAARGVAAEDYADAPLAAYFAAAFDGLPQNARILDFGCGFGQNLIAIKEGRFGFDIGAALGANAANRGSAAAKTANLANPRGDLANPSTAGAARAANPANLGGDFGGKEGELRGGAAR